MKKVIQKEPSLFGYYNMSPENAKNQVLVSVISDEKTMSIYLMPEEKLLVQTYAWNLQQGCMMQWHKTDPSCFYYNRFNVEKQIYEGVLCKIEENRTKELQVYAMPIYSIDLQDRFALTLNFERLTVMRPDYGYFCRENIILPEDDQDGVFYVDLLTNKVSLIISLETLKNIHPVPSMQNAKHKVNHIDIAPDGKRFMFLHRWVGPQGRFMRLVTANVDGSDLFILNGDIMTSHSCWVNSQDIISFCYTPRYNNSYICFHDKSKQYELLSEKLPHVDGHPTVSPNGEWMVTDCYPALYHRFSSIFLYNRKTNDLFTAGQFYQPLKYNGPSRIDLHPKWSPDGQRIYFESGHNGNRNLYTLRTYP